MTGIALVHRIPPVGLKCLSERRRREMATLLGGRDHGSRWAKHSNLFEFYELS
jgi:hypothetical protein